MFKVYDLDGATILPGIHDVHLHPLEAGSEVGGTCELPVDTAPEDMIDLIKKRSTKQKGTDWVLGHGYSIEPMLRHVEDNGRLPKDILDEAVPNKPAIMMEETSHSVWVNSKALQMANIDGQTPDRPGGIIMKDVTNEPNGILLENEGIEIVNVAMKPTKRLEKYNFEGLLYGLEQIRKNGITSICDARVFWKQNHQQCWYMACEKGLLTVRTILGFWIYPTMDDDEQINTLKQLHSSHHCNNNCLLRQNQVKMYSDGLLENTTAALHNPYLKQLRLKGLEKNVGMNYFSQKRIEKYLSSLQTFDEGKHFDFHIHAIGDRAVHEVLNAIENTKVDGPRHRMTHLELVHHDDIKRFRELGVVADFQVGHHSLPEYRDNLADLVGSDRSEHYIPVRSVHDTGAVVTLSSDWDVNELNPFEGMKRAVSRGDQSVSLKKAIEMYTINGAIAMRQEHLVGSLEVGKEADFVVIDKDIMNIDTEIISNLKVRMTVLRGKIVYTHKSRYPKKYTLN